MQDLNLLKNGLSDIGFETSSEILTHFQTFYEMLIDWNKKMNLTAITEYEEVVVKHFLDSVNIAQVFDMSKVKKVLDVGTGAGFPGIPLKIMYPEIDVVLMDALNKRVQFMNNVVNSLDLKLVEPLHSRAEILAKDESHREQYDLVVSRAVSNLSTLAEYTLPFVSVGGYFVAYKSEQSDKEIELAEHAIEVLGGQIESIKVSTIPGSDYVRKYVIIKKIKATPSKYPRKAGIPSKKPL